jgi:PKD repeat protein
VLGMFLSGNTIYAGRSSNGELRQIGFVNGAPSGAWSLAAPGPGAGGQDWRTRVMFLGPGGPNQAPTAAFTSTCAGLVCTFDASGSTDKDGTVTGYAWDFGDGATATGRTVTHAFPSAGTRSVTLTVTDDQQATG